MTARRAAFALVAALCLASLSGAWAQPKPSLDGNGGTFASFNASQYKFTFELPPKKENGLTGNTAAALAPTGFGSRLFALKPCQLFVPHFHPGAAEYFIGVRGKINLVAYINQKLVKNTIDVKGIDSLIVPINTFHYFYNSECSPAAVISSLNSAAAGFQGYYNLPKDFTDTVADASDVAMLIDTKAPNATLDAARSFFDLTTKCARKCGYEKDSNNDDDDDDYYWKDGKKIKKIIRKILG